MLEKQTPGYLTAELDSLLSIKVGGVVFYIGHLKVSLDVYLTLFYRLKPNNWLAAFEQVRNELCKAGLKDSVDRTLMGKSQ